MGFFTFNKIKKYFKGKEINTDLILLMATTLKSITLKTA